MQRSVFRDFDEFAEFVRGIEGRFMPTGPSSTEWWVQGSQASRVSVQELQIGACATFAGTGEPGKIAVGVPMTDARRMRIDATALRDDSFILMQGAQPFTFTGIGPTRWAGITLPFDHPCLDPRTLELLVAGRSVRKRTQVESLTHLRGLVNRMLSSDPAVRVATPAAAAMVEQDISLAIARVLQSSCDGRETKRGRLHAYHARAVARCLDLIDATHAETLYIEDLARVAAVSERTLRTLFQQYLGFLRYGYSKQSSCGRSVQHYFTANPESACCTSQKGSEFGISVYLRATIGRCSRSFPARRRKRPSASPEPKQASTGSSVPRRHFMLKRSEIHNRAGFC